MRRLPLVLTLTLAVTLACGGVLGGGEPEFEREYYKIASRPAGVFKDMDLPYYGGKLEKCTDSLLEVTYPSDGLGPEKLGEYWPAALKAEGWTARSEKSNPDGGFTGSYELPDGKTATLSIDPQGTLWIVSIVIT